MNRKPICKCQHTATQHANVKYTNKKGETKTYTNCRVCECKGYEAIVGTTPEFPEVFTQGKPEETPTKE
jgi:hypothetical protein